jgi:hypothetical protein
MCRMSHPIRIIFAGCASALLDARQSGIWQKKSPAGERGQVVEKVDSHPMREPVCVRAPQRRFRQAAGIGRVAKKLIRSLSEHALDVLQQVAEHLRQCRWRPLPPAAGDQSLPARSVRESWAVPIVVRFSRTICNCGEGI